MSANANKTRAEDRKKSESTKTMTTIESPSSGENKVRSDPKDPRLPE